MTRSIILSTEPPPFLQAAIAEAEANSEVRSNLPIVDIWKILFP